MSLPPTTVVHADLASFVSFGEALTDMIRVDQGHWRSRSGGSPWNVAIAMSRLGQLSAFAGGISKDLFGQAIWQASADASLDLRFIQQFAKSPLVAYVHQLDPPAYAFVGDDSADLHFRPHALPAGWRRALRWAHFGSISLTREPLAARLIALAESLKDEGVRISYDPNYRMSMDSRYDRTLERMCRLADVIKVSDEDLRGLFRSRDHHLGLAQISAWNPRAIVMLTLGERGAQLFHPKADLSAAPPPLDHVVDTLGAGDVAMAGLLYSLMNGGTQDPEDHLRWAVAAGAAACAGAGVDGLSAGLVTSLIDQVQVRRAEMA
jgi:fructokinase